MPEATAIIIPEKRGHMITKSCGEVIFTSNVLYSFYLGIQGGRLYCI